MPQTYQWKRDSALWGEFSVATLTSIPLAQWAPVNEFLRSYLDGRRGDLYPTIVSLEGTILGFVLAALTIVLGYANSPRFEVLRETRHWERVFRAYTRAAKWTAVALLYGLAALFFDSDTAPNYPLCVMMLATILLATARVAWVLYMTERIVRVIVKAYPRAAGT